MDLTPIDLPTLQAWQKQAITAFGQVMSTGRAVSVSYAQGDGSRSVTYSPADIATMRAWISTLANEIGCRTGVPPRQTRRAIGVRFG